MSRIADLVQRGVRVTVANQAKGEPTEIPADFFEGHEARAAARFDSPAEIEALTREAAAAVNTLTRLQTRQRAEEERFHRTISLFVEPMPARVIPMASRPTETAAAAPAAPAHPPESKSELKLVAPAPLAPAPAPKPAASAPATASDPSKDEAKS